MWHLLKGKFYITLANLSDVFKVKLSKFYFAKVSRKNTKTMLKI